MTDGMGPDHSIRDPRAKESAQQVTNEVWPHDATKIHDQPAEKQLDVRVRVVFLHDGEQWLEGRAVRWRRQHVCVQVSDRRIRTGLVWVLAADVRRRRPD